MKKKRKKKQMLYIFDQQKLRQAINLKNEERPYDNFMIRKGNFLTLYTLFENYQNLLNEKTTKHTFEYTYVHNNISKVNIGPYTMPRLYIHASKIASQTGFSVKTIKKHIRQIRHESKDLISIIDTRTRSSFEIIIPYHYFVKVLKLKTQ